MNIAKPLRYRYSPLVFVIRADKIGILYTLRFSSKVSEAAEKNTPLRFLLQLHIVIAKTDDIIFWQSIFLTVAI